MVKNKETARKRGWEVRVSFLKFDERGKKKKMKKDKEKKKHVKRKKKQWVHRPRDDKRVPCMASDDRKLRNNILLKKFPLPIY